MPRFVSSSVVLAAMTLAAPGKAMTNSERPISLIAEPTDTGLIVRVVGESATNVKLSYKLELGAGSGNRVSQSGAADLKAGEAPQTLATIRINGREAFGRLVVLLSDGTSYEELIPVAGGR